MTAPADQWGWTAEEIKLLGTKPDEEVAHLLRRSAEAVSLKRQKLHIPAPLQPPWTGEETKLLGTRPDREIARLLDRSEAAVQTKRLQLGIRIWKATAPKSREPVNADKLRLLFGPYQPPRTRRGKHLFCEMRGTVKVGDYCDGPIPWPMKWRTRSLILCGDLVRAVREESGLAVAHHWGVCPALVTKWRGALEVGPMTAGTTRLKSVVQTEAMTPALRAHLSRVKAGKPVHLSGRGKARLMAALHRPKPAEWFQSMAKHWAARRGKPVNPEERAWTPAEEALLGTRPDRELAQEMNRSVVAVAARRRRRKIPCPNPLVHPWKDSEIALLRQLPDAAVAQRTGHPLRSVQSKRESLGLWVRPRPKPWTRAEEGLLGQKPDTEVAAMLRRGRADVRRRRIALNIKPAVARVPHRDWTPEEDRLLGTASDAAVGRKLGRSPVSVQLRRLGLGLPSHRALKEQLTHPAQGGSDS